MRGLLISMAVLLCPAAALAAEAPFAPLPNVVDYIATTVGGWAPRLNEVGRITHHAPWTRIDGLQNGRNSRGYVNDDKTVSIDLQYGASGKYAYLSIVRQIRPPDIPSWFRGSFRTGERQSVLGESCDVWEIRRWRSYDVPPRSFSCVTDDGVELWQKVMYSDGSLMRSVEVTEIRRQPVPDSEVRLPDDVLDLNSWIDPSSQPGGNAASPTGSGEFEAVLRDRGTIWRVRRHYPWTYSETLLAGGMRQLSIVNEKSGLNLSFESTAGDEFKELMVWKVSGEIVVGIGPLTPVDLGRKETVLSEECTWFDMLPRVEDVGHYQCQTTDGIPLKDERWSRGTSRTRFVAVEFQRRDITIAEVMPPGDIFSHAKWGIPE
jgi:hypothetical protein